MFIGATESGDAGLDLSWSEKLYDANILITKNPTSKRFKELVIVDKNKIIIHINITGMGGSKIEPFVPTKEKIYTAVKELLLDGFPVEQLVLRVDPIVPTEKGINTALSVLELFKDTGIARCRYSFMDMYNHVKTRFVNNGIGLPYNNFHAPINLRKSAAEKLDKYKDIYQFEVCAEPYSKHQDIGCISNKDLSILGLESQSEEGLGKQRKLCSCLPNKKELLTKKARCAHKCEYCYWQGD